MKICNVCLEEKPLDEFYARSARCKSCHNEYTKAHYQANKKAYVDKAKRAKDKIVDFLREAKSVPCTDCGVSYPAYVMDFDHLENKEFNLGGSAGKVGLATIKREIAKCEVVCSNCHRIRTHNRRVL